MMDRDSDEGDIIEDAELNPRCQLHGEGSLPIARNANADRLAEKFRRLAATVSGTDGAEQ